MYKVLIPLAILSLVSLNCAVKAADDASTAPTEVGSTTMPAGQYSLIEQSTGKKYSLMITTKGTMICGPAPTVPTTTTGASTTTATKTSGLEGLAKTQMQKGMSTLIEKQGINELKNFVK